VRSGRTHEHGGLDRLTATGRSPIQTVVSFFGATFRYSNSPYRDSRPRIQIQDNGSIREPFWAGVRASPRPSSRRSPACSYPNRRPFASSKSKNGPAIRGQGSRRQGDFGPGSPDPARLGGVLSRPARPRGYESRPQDVLRDLRGICERLPGGSRGPRQDRRDVPFPAGSFPPALPFVPS
jgi:hypothetical protein